MKMSGTGEVFLADEAQEIHLLRLENDAITVNGRDLLAFDAGIDWDIKRVEGATGMMAGGLFNTALQGYRLGGGPLRRAAGAPQPRGRAHVRRSERGDHLGLHREDSVKTDIKLKSFIGRGSGESIQMSFTGPGWVLVQPSEGRVQPTQGGGRRAPRQPGRLSRRGPSPLQFVKSCARLAFVCLMRAVRSAQPRTSSAGSGRSS